MAILYRSVYAPKGIPLDSIVVTTMPTTTSYSVGDILDTTGLVITATADLISGDVTSYCSFFPIVLDTAGTQEIIVSYMNKTTSFYVTVS